MHRILFFIMAFCSLLVSGESLLLRDNLDQAEAGDYLVLAQGKCYTLFHIFDRSNGQLTIEEVTIPANLASSFAGNWRGWLESGAPHNSSWTLFQIDLSSGQMHHFFSFTRNGWFTIPQEENFLQTLLQLPFQPVTLENKRRIGPKPHEGAPDIRPFWTPKMVINGQTVHNQLCESFISRWPSDGSKLAGKTISIFLLNESAEFPSYFPFWMQLKGGIGRAHVRVVDGGKGAHSPRNGYPAIPQT
jgi:hypothetical protein